MKKKIKLAVNNEPVLLSNLDAFSSKGFSVDAENGLFKNVAIITKGPALGHGFDIDNKTLRQVRDSINSLEIGIKSRLTHPGGSIFGPSTDAIEVMVGRAKNARIEGDKVKGDIQLGQYSKKSPKGNLWDYLTAIASEDPQAAGLSISFFPGEHQKRKDENDNPLPPACRVEKVVGVDFVGNPGANPSGFLTGDSSNLRKEFLMNKKLRKFLIQHGLSEDATDVQAIEYWHNLEGKQKWVADALAEGKASDDEKSEAEKKKLEEEAKAQEELEAKQKADEEAKKKADPKVQARLDAEKAEKAAVLADRQRRTDIEKLAEEHKLPSEWAKGLWERGVSLAQATDLVEVADLMQPVKVGEDKDKATLAEAMEDAILLKSGVVLAELDPETGIAIRDENDKVKIRKPHERASKFRALSISDMGRRYLASLGVLDADFMSKPALADLLFSPMALYNRYGITALAQGTSDFPFILANVLNKSLLAAYAEAPTDWPKFCSRATHPDFKQFSLVALSEAPDLTRQYEGEGIDYGTLDERREVGTLVVFNKGLRFTRIMFVNDDLNAFSRNPKLLGLAAKRLEDDVAFAIVTGGLTTEVMSDGNFLWDAANHGNYIAAGAVPSVATLNAAEAAMGIQRGMLGLSYLQIKPKTIIHPFALNGVIKQLMVSTVVPGATLGHSANVWAGRLEQVVNARLDTFNANGWFLAGDPNLHSTIVMNFLESEQTPVTKQEMDFDTDDLKYSVRHTLFAKAIDWKALYYNDGA